MHEPAKRPRLAMTVMNDITGDSRVKKSAVSAKRLGFDVAVFGFAAQPFETDMAGIRLVRVSRNAIPTERAPFLDRRRGRLVVNLLAPFGFRTRAGLDRALERSTNRGRPTTTFGRTIAAIRKGVFRVRRKGYVGSRWAATGALRQSLRRSEPTIETFLEQRLPGLHGPSCALADAVASFEPDFIHAHDITTLQIPSLIGELHGIEVPWLYDAHELVPGIHSSDRTRTEALVDMERRWAPHADRVICVSEPLADILSTSLPLDERPLVVLNAPPENLAPTTARIRSAVGIDDDAPIVVYPGVVKPMRGLDVVVEALCDLDDVHLVVVSDPTSPGVNDLRHHAMSIGVADRLHVVPYVAASDVAAFISDATIGIHPLRHYANAEIALPTKLFEFLHARLPVVVSDVAEMQRFVREHDVGVVFDAGDVADCADAIRRAIGNAAALRLRITGDLQAAHSWQWQEKQLARAYAEALDSEPAMPDATVDFTLVETDLSQS